MRLGVRAWNGFWEVINKWPGPLRDYSTHSTCDCETLRMSGRINRLTMAPSTYGVRGFKDHRS